MYKFCKITDTNKFQRLIKSQLSELQILGTIILGNEGLNGTISGSPKSLKKAITFLRSLENFEDLDMKESTSMKKPFLRLKIRIKEEIVSMGLKNIDPIKQAGTYVKPEEWNKLLEESNTILIDTRNNYEYSIGSFNKSINPNRRY